MEMREQILGFYLTDHFMLQGWSRSIDKSVLYQLLPYVDAGKTEKKLVVITPAFYNSKGVRGREKQCLVFVLKQKLIMTGYWCVDPNYLFKTERGAEFQWLYN